jgi:hypothetical protein
MPRRLTRFGFAALSIGSAFGQSTKAAFQIADVHASAPSSTFSRPAMIGGVLIGGRYELRKATMGT